MPAVSWRPSLAGQLPQGFGYIRKIQVGFEAAFASKPAPTGFRVYPQNPGWLWGCLRERACSHRGC